MSSVPSSGSSSTSLTPPLDPKEREAIFCIYEFPDPDTSVQKSDAAAKEEMTCHTFLPSQLLEPDRADLQRSTTQYPFPLNNQVTVHESSASTSDSQCWMVYGTLKNLRETANKHLNGVLAKDCELSYFTKCHLTWDTHWNFGSLCAGNYRVKFAEANTCKEAEEDPRYYNKLYFNELAPKIQRVLAAFLKGWHRVNMNRAPTDKTVKEQLDKLDRCIKVMTEILPMYQPAWQQSLLNHVSVSTFILNPLGLSRVAKEVSAYVGRIFDEGILSLFPKANNALTLFPDVAIHAKIAGEIAEIPNSMKLHHGRCVTLLSANPRTDEDFQKVNKALIELGFAACRPYEWEKRQAALKESVQQMAKLITLRSGQTLTDAERYRDSVQGLFELFCLPLEDALGWRRAWNWLAKTPFHTSFNKAALEYVHEIFRAFRIESDPKAGAAANDRPPMNGTILEAYGIALDRLAAVFERTFGVASTAATAAN